MTQYGDKQEPGIVTELTSSAVVPTAGESPNDLGIVGQANLGNSTAEGSADPNTVYEVTRASKAVDWFGSKDTSLLTNAVVDALNEGAFPVYVVATASTSVSNEDHSSTTSTTVDLDNEPIREDADSITVSLDGSDQTVNIVYDDVSTYSPTAGECYVNPVRSKVEIESTPSTSLDIDYDHFDYSSGIDTMESDAGDTIDFLCPLNENTTVADAANTKVGDMQDNHQLAIALVGAGIRVTPSSFSQSYDDSRTQTLYPTRFEDNTSALGAYAGRKAALGITTTAINKRLREDHRLAIDLTRSQRSDLISENCVPLADEAAGARVTDDPTTVSDTNTDESNLDYGFTRLLMDYIITTTWNNEKPFIGRLNSPQVRDTMANLIRKQLSSLEKSNSVLSYEVDISQVDATTAKLDVKIDLADPLRFVENTVTVGQGA